MRPALPKRVTPEGPAAGGRRGVLLLVVLSMLTLFLMLGATYLVVAIRARETARAYARLTFGGDDARIPHAHLLDAVALNVIRGGHTPTASGVLAPTVSFESLLADRYGATTLTGTATTLSFSGIAPVITGTIILSSTVRPADLNGRVLTFTAPGRRPSSHRIIRARPATGTANPLTTNFTIALDVPSRGSPFTLPTNGSRVIVNGREFAGVPAASGTSPPSNENWDGFDFHNPYLAKPEPGSTIATSTVSRLSYTGATPSGFGPTWEYDAPDQVAEAADNDGDGEPDGIFLDFGLPTLADATGNPVQLRASVLVVDLDGRFNVNAHGSLGPMLYTSASGTHPGWTTDNTITTTGSLAMIPLGSGYGPAEIQANLGRGSEPKTPSTITSGTPRMFDTASLVATGTESPRLGLLTGLRSGTGTTIPRMQGLRTGSSRFTTTPTTQTPWLRPTEGKYGEQAPAGWLSGTAGNLADGTIDYARPGQPNISDPAGLMVARQAYPTVSATISNGVPLLWWNGSGTFHSGSASTTYPRPRGIYNSPPDLHGRMKTLTLSATTSGASALAPRLVFAQPEWSTSTDFREIKDNPYELRLDTRVGFGGLLKDPATDGMNLGTLADNPFTPADLEAVLRPYDLDTNRCQPRLAAMLGSAGEDSRLKVTTDSWDTTAITGGTSATGTTGAATRISNWLGAVTTGTLYGTNSVTGIIGGEVSRGERFNLRRPLPAFTLANVGYAAANPYYLQRQAYFKDFYTLLIALDGGASAPLPSRAAELAQWAANVVEFSDSDSRMTPFEYDKNPQNGWDVDGDVTTADGGSDRGVVWGAERPEILIQEAFAWRVGPAATEGGLGVVLHRPWNAIAVASGSTSRISAEPCDFAFDTLCSDTDVSVIIGTTGIPGNIVDLGKKAGPHVLSLSSGTNYGNTTAAPYPIWRLRLVSGTNTSYVRFDTNSPGTNEFTVTPMTNGDDKPKMAVDSTLSLYSSASVQFKVSGATVAGSLSLSGSSRQLMTNARFADGPPLSPTASGTVYLERLSDPSVVPTAAQWTSDPVSDPDVSTTSLRYVIVDSADVPIANTETGAGVVSTQRAAPAGGFWRNTFQPGFTLVPGETAPYPTAFTAAERDNNTWFHWPNRPLSSPAELTLIPKFGCVSGTATAAPYPKLLDQYHFITAATIPAVTPITSGSLTAANLFDAVQVPTWFAGIHGTTNIDTFATTGIDLSVTPVNQFSAFREPGRVNLNTVTSDDVWNSVVGGPLPGVLTTRAAAAFATTPGTSMADMLQLSTSSGGLIVSDTAAPLNTTANPLHRSYTATRLMNTVTPRSNVFAIWVTLRAMVPNDPDSVRYHRAFYIVDRSIPVGFEEGSDHNVSDCIRLRRIIE
jgi:hypothetical protein